MAFWRMWEQDNLLLRFFDLYLLLQFVKTTKTAEFLSLFEAVGIVPVEKHVVILMDKETDEPYRPLWTLWLLL